MSTEQIRPLGADWTCPPGAQGIPIDEVEAMVVRCTRCSWCAPLPNSLLQEGSYIDIPSRCSQCSSDTFFEVYTSTHTTTVLQRDQRLQLFRLGDEANRIWHNSHNEFLHTIEAMREMDLYHLPYPIVTVEISNAWLSGKFLDPATDPRDWTEDELTVAIRDAYNGCVMHGLTERGCAGVEPILTPQGLAYQKRSGQLPLQISYDPGTLETIRAALIVLCATPTAERTTNTFTKRSRRPTHISHRYSSVTTITGRSTAPSQLCSTTTPGDSPRTVTTHLRRGHIRTQWYGPSRSFSKQVWIAPTIVNASEGMPSERTAYNVSPRREE